MFKKVNLKVVMIFMLVLALFTSGINITTASAASKQATITVIGENGKILYPETNVSIGDNENAFDALVGAVGSDNVKYTQFSFGKWIDSIFNLAGTSDYSKYWGFVVNGTSSSTGASSYIVQDGDKLTFQYVDTTASVAQKQASITVIGENGKVLYPETNVSIGDNENAFDALVSAVGSDNVKYIQYSFGKWIDSIFNLAGTSDYSKYWGFIINGTTASTGADSYIVQDGDKLKFQYIDNTASTGNTSTKTGGNSNTSDNHNSATPAAVSGEKLQNAIDLASQYTLNNWTDDNTWGAIALKQAGKTIPPSYLAAIKTDIQNKGGSFHYITDTEKYALGVLAANEDPTNISGYNLLESIYNGNVTKQGINGVAYALIALDAPRNKLNGLNFPIPDSATWTREKLINQLLSNQQPDGHWSLSATDSSSDIDITAMVLSALAPYKDQADVKPKIDSAVSYLSSQYQASKIDNSLSVAQVVIALSTLGIDANGSSFTKDNVSLFQYLLSFQNSDGGFGWKSGDKSDTFSTPQGFEALVAYQLFTKGGTDSLYNPLGKVNPNQNQNTVPPILKKPLDGNLLPNTATNSENILLVGALLVIAGMTLVYFNNKRKA